jgi:hypothetical protein
MYRISRQAVVAYIRNSRDWRLDELRTLSIPRPSMTSVSKTTVLESWIPYRSGSFKGSNLVTSQEPAVRFLLSYDHSLTFGGKIGYLHPFRSTDAPPAAAHHPLTQEVLANSDAVLAEAVLLGCCLLKADPPSPFREWRRVVIGCYQQGHLHTSEGVLPTA